jgi:PCFT/HCP family folate transporter-like MFS transporter 1/3
MGIVLLVLLPVFSNYLKLNDATISIIGMLCASVRFLILAWSEESWMVWLAVVVGSLAGIINSPVRSLLSKLVNENEIGKMFSILGTGETIAKFTAVVFTSIYGYSLNIFAGMPFVIAAILYTAMILLVLLMHVNFKSDRCDDLDSTKTDSNGSAKHVKSSDMICLTRRRFVRMISNIIHF